MSEVRYFDANCMIGRTTKPVPGSITEVDELLSEMAYLGVLPVMKVLLTTVRLRDLAGDTGIP